MGKVNWEEVDIFVHDHEKWFPGFVVSYVCYRYDRYIGMPRSEAKIGWLW